MAAAVGPQPIRHGVEIAGEHRQFVLAVLEPALTRTSRFSAGERPRALLDAAYGCAQVLREPPAGEGADHQRDAQNHQGDAGQAQGAEDARAAGHEQHRIGRCRRGRRSAARRAGGGNCRRRPIAAVPRSAGAGSAMASRLKNSRRRAALSDRRRPRMSRPSGPMMKRSRSAIECSFVREPVLQRRDAAAGQHLARPGWRGAAGAADSRDSYSRAATVKVTAMLAADDERHRDPEQHENPQEQAVHLPATAAPW